MLRPPAQRQVPGSGVDRSCPGYNRECRLSDLESGDHRDAALQLGQVVIVKGSFQPLHRTCVVDLPGDGSPVRADKVDLRIECAVPPSANGNRLRSGKLTGGERQGFAYQGLDGPPTP